MLYADHRLSQALSDLRLEQAKHIQGRHLAARASRYSLSHQLGHLLISIGEKLAGKHARAA